MYGQQSKPYGVLKKFRIAGAGGWDYLAVCNQKLYVSHGNQVNILDAASGDSLGIIQNTRGVHGIALVPALGKGFTSNGSANTITVFDLRTQVILDSITTGENPDAILYEPFTKTIITCNGRSNNLSVINPETKTTIATIPVGGKPETAVTDSTGNLYVNIEDKSEIVVVDLKTFSVKAHWPLYPGSEPTGLAIDLKTERLFAACNKLLVVLHARTGKIVDMVPIGAGCDGVVFDANRNLIFTANGVGSITVIAEKSSTKFTVVHTIPTKRGARTIAIDAQTGTLFLPTADFEKAVVKTGRPKMVAGTFQVLVIH
ncbi:MAG TPA: hypothetical protein VM010_01465 [Chitinophagaceae bacterium]|nr:hypothetical protein [Chitinophagaceae bacterium]